MDGFLGLDNQLIKVEVEENPNFHCIICKGEFLTRTARNEHLETHFIHRNCENCSRPVIVIGDLEFELHHPKHCTENEDDVLDGEYLMDIKTEDEYDFNDDGVVTERDSEIESSQNTKQHIINAESNNDETSELVNEIEGTKKRSARKVKRKLTRKCRKSKQNNDENDFKSDEKYDDVTSDQAESEDELIKEMDVAMNKRRKQYAKLPKIVPCTMCTAMFGTERTLKIHMHREHGIKERYICPICDREFKISGNLKQHIETHSDYKRFICSYCGKGFHLPFNLKEHMNTHTGDRPYECDVCGKTFGRNSLRQAHMRVHTGEKPYKCDIDTCDRAYAYQTDLKRHKRSVHGIIDKTFPCPVCGKVFYENKFLTKHLNVHKENN